MCVCVCTLYTVKFQPAFYLIWILMKNNLQYDYVFVYASHIKPKQYVLLYPWMMVACDNSNDNDYDFMMMVEQRRHVCLYASHLCSLLLFSLCHWSNTDIMLCIQEYVELSAVNIYIWILCHNIFHLQNERKKKNCYPSHNNIALYYSDAHYTLLRE